ncbi:hypothetical protein QC760_008122 [Botrytis cinerea]
MHSERPLQPTPQPPEPQSRIPNRTIMIRPSRSIMRKLPSIQSIGTKSPDLFAWNRFLHLSLPGAKKYYRMRVRALQKYVGLHYMIMAEPGRNGRGKDRNKILGRETAGKVGQ